MKRTAHVFLVALFFASLPFPARADSTVVFNEIMYHPATNEAAAEWVELYNQMAVDVDISGWSLAGGINYTFASNTIVRGGGFVVVAVSPGILTAATGLTNVLGPFAGRLSNSGELIQLRNNSGRVVDEANYGVEGDWPVAADGGGVSLAKLEHDTASGPAENWTISSQIGGTPGVENFPNPNAIPLVTVAFNEFSASTNAEFWLELANFGTNSLSLDGYVIALDATVDSEYVFPAGPPLLAGGYIAITNTSLGFHPVSGDKLYLLPLTRDKVLDAVVIKSAALGRSPDGSGFWLYPSAPTPGASNSFAFHREIVINEIMYQHKLLPATNNLPPQPSSEAWIELYNRSTNLVDLTGWRLDGGISYQFPVGKTIGPGSFLVVAKDAAALQAVYPSADVVGNYNKNLSGRSDTILMIDPAGNPANRVRYFDDGRWLAYANGGGSSLELLDPTADNSRPEAWTASDETHKSAWQTFTYRAVAQTIVGPELWNDFILGLLSDGQCLVDDISVVQSPTNNPVQFIANGNFESGLTGWRVLGNHRHSQVEVDPDNLSNHVLHIMASGPQEHMHNHIETTFANGHSVANGRTYEISFRARWLAGNSLLNTRLYFDRAAKTTALPMPVLNGTPGTQNSRYATNIGPTFSQFQHSAVVPQPGNPVTVSVLAQDPQGVSTCQFWWSTNGGAFSNASMTLQGGGLYRGTIPGYPAGTIVQFYVRAVDGLGAASTYPAGGTNSGALYAVADGQANLNLGHNIRIVITPANSALLYGFTNVMSNENLPCTVIYDEKRAYYDVGLRLKGSQHGRYLDSRVSFHLEFQPDDLFRGVHPVMLIDRAGSGDSTVNKQQEIVVRHMLLHAGGIPGIQPDMCRVIAPLSSETGPAIFSPRTEDEFIASAYVDGNSGTEWEYELIYYPTTANPSGYKNPQPDGIIGVDISNLGDDKEIYRYLFILKNHRDADDYSRFITFAKTFSLPTGPVLEAQAKQVMDVGEWMRVFAFYSLCGVGDNYTLGNNHNLMFYLRPSDQKMLAFPWDMDVSFAQSPTAPLIGNQNLSRIENRPANKRSLYAHALDIIGSTYNASYMNSWVSHYASFAPGQDYSGVISYIQQRTTAVLNEINGAGGNAPFALNGTNFIVASSNLVTFTGTAPVQAQTILVNGVPYPVTWTSVSTWVLRIPVSSPTNVLNFSATDLNGSPLTNLTGTVTVNYTGPTPDPLDAIVINEIMDNPVLPGASYVELFNRSSNFSFDLSNWRVDGLDYVFAPGSIITNGQFLVLTRGLNTFSAAYGTGITAFDQFPGNLKTNGEKLALLMPGALTNQEIVVDQVRYETSAPWPVTPPGVSLQLIDPSQDNARVANWGAVQPGTPPPPQWVFSSASGTASSSTLYIYLQSAGDAYLDDVKLAAGNAQSVPIPGLFGTGVNNAGAILPDNSVDPHYQLIQSADSGFPGPNARTVNHAYPVAPNGPWISAGANSYWIGPRANQSIGNAPGDYIYRTTFDLTGFDLNTVRLDVQWSCDSEGLDVKLKGISTGQTIPPYPPQPSEAWHPFVITNGFVAGTNTLDFVINRNGGVYPTGLRAEVTGSGVLVSQLGTNVLANGDFESAFPGPWSVSSNLIDSTVSTTIKHSGNASLHVISSSAGSSQSTAIYQVISPGLALGQSYTLSFWYRQSTNGGPLVVRLSGSGVAANVNPAPPPGLAQSTATPGTANNVQTSLPVFPPLWINELQADNLTGITNSAGQRTSWLEIYNPSTNVVSLSGLYLANNYTNLTKWDFPTGAVINPGQFKVIFADGQTNLSTLAELHANFALASGAGALVLSQFNNNQPEVLDYINYTNLVVNHSYGSIPDGQGVDRRELFFATPGNTNNGALPPITVYVNEWLADNSHTLVNPVSGKYDDWFELYNPGTNAVDLGGYYLTDDLANKTKSLVPNNGHYVVPPGGFLLVWTDNNLGGNATNRPELHANFALSKSGEAIGLFAADGTAVDAVTFGAQTSDVSQGRFPDGAGGIYAMPTPTPGAPNVAPNTAPVLSPISDRNVILGQTLTFTVSATDTDQPPQTLTFSLGAGKPDNATISAASGMFNWTPTAASSTNFVPVIVTDNGTPNLSATQTFKVTVYLPPQLSAVYQSGNQFTFTWPAPTGQTYQIEYKDDLAAGSWIPLGSPVAGNGGSLTFTNNLTASAQRFFRLRIEP